VFPWLLWPPWLRRWWLVEVVWLRLLLIAAVLLLFFSPLLMFLGMASLTEGRNSTVPFIDTEGLTSLGLGFFVASLVACCVLCALRACVAPWKRDRRVNERRYEEQTRPTAGDEFLEQRRDSQGFVQLPVQSI